MFVGPVDLLDIVPSFLAENHTSAMTSTNDVLEVNLALCLGATLSFVYAVAVLIFRASAHECSWTAMTGAILIRASFLIACISVGISLTDSSNFNVFIVAGIISNAVSIYLIANISSVYVQGPKPRLKAGCMKDRVVLITGANTGIGKETARQLLEVGATVIFACRSEKRGRAAMEEIACEVEPDNVDLKPLSKRMHFLELDLSNLSSIRTAVQKFEQMGLPLHILINNAGVLMGEHKKSDDGYELMMACNHLGHFLLTNLLLNKLRESQNARVVTLTSSTYKLATHMDLEDLFCEKGRAYTLFGQYAQSKLANILFSSELAKREQKHVTKMKGKTASDSISCYAVHPGLVRTDVVKNMPFWLRQGNFWFGLIIGSMQKTPSAGAYTSVWCATSDDAKGSSGLYFANSTAESLGRAARDEEVSALI